MRLVRGVGGETRRIFVTHTQRLEVRETSDVKYEIDDTVSYHTESDDRPGTKGLKQLLPPSHFYPLCAVAVSVTGPIDQKEPINRFVLHTRVAPGIFDMVEVA